MKCALLDWILSQEEKKPTRKGIIIGTIGEIEYGL